MKALILAAGFGTRLRPYTQMTPKPLFTIGGQPIIDRLIASLRKAKCNTIIINSHHLAYKIEAFLKSKPYDFPVHLRYEPEILGTGGAIKNIADLLDDQPFFVINSDIVTDIDLRRVYKYHLKHRAMATLVLVDDARFNSVRVDGDGHIDGFSRQSSGRDEIADPMTFTGIQVLDPAITGHIPGGEFVSSIDIYQRLIEKNHKIKAFIAHDYSWDDIGTPERYRDVNINYMAPRAFHQAFPTDAADTIRFTKLKGDGSDRRWRRLTSGSRSLIMADHGIRGQSEPSQTTEAEAFIAIGRHLRRKGLPVPKIYLWDALAGLVFMEDLGDLHLQRFVHETNQTNQIFSLYQQVIDRIIALSIKGRQDFDLAWTWQTTHYDQDLILEKECRYFIDAFFNTYLGKQTDFDSLSDEFKTIADNALQFGTIGFMHRDMQSRNIMVKDDKVWFIDFQGGRIGPLQYDLASLLIDPYVALSVEMQTRLLKYAFQGVSSCISVDRELFKHAYYHCALARNLQILGAFGFLAKVKKKRFFIHYIPIALHTLKNHLNSHQGKYFPKLKELVSTLHPME